MAPNDSRPQPHRIYLWLLALACFVAVLGARTAYVHHFGSDLPTWDQWDAESQRLLLPYEQGRLRLSDLFEPHNEHRIVATKLLALALYRANGQWDARLECTANAAMVAGFAVFLLFFGRRLIDRRWHAAWLVAVFALFAAPLSWQNTIGGFHTQQTFLLIFSFSAIALLTTVRPTDARWWIGSVCALAALFTMGSGLLAAAAAAATLVLTSPPNQWLRRHGVTVALCGIVMAIGLSLHHPAPYHEVLQAHSVREFALCFWRSLQWPLLYLPVYGLVSWLPWAALAWRVWRQREAAAAGERIVVGAGVWVLLQYAASAYARGAGGAWPADRYLDTVGFGIAVNLLALLILFSRAPLPGWRAHVRTAAALVGVAVLTQGWWRHVSEIIHQTGPALRAENIDREFHTRAYVQTGDAAYLREGHIPHPSVDVLKYNLTQPEIRRALPASVRVPLDLPGSTDATGGFRSPGVPPELKRLPGWPMIGSYGAGDVATWTSPELPPSTHGYWVIPTVTEETTAGGLIVELSDGGKRHRLDLTPGHDPRLPDPTWNLNVVPSPRAAGATIHAVDSTPLGWMAFGAPSEMASGSYWAWRLGGAGMLLFWGGAFACGLVEVRLAARYGWLSFAPDWIRREYGTLPHPVAFIAAAACALAGGALAYVAVDPREPAFFVATIRGDLDGHSIELFYDRGHGIRGADSAQYWFHEDVPEVLVRLPLPPGTYRKFRLDPMDFGTTTVIDSPRIEDERGTVLMTLQPSAFVAGPDVESVRIDGPRAIIQATPTGADPQTVVRLDPPFSTRSGARGQITQWLAAALTAACSIIIVMPAVAASCRWAARRARHATGGQPAASAEAPPRAPLWRRVREDRSWGIVAIAATALATIALRKADSFVNPQLWAEDASIFFVQAEDQGIGSLFQPFAGYIHAVPRLLAWVGTLFDARWLPHAYAWLSAGVLMLAAAHTLSPRLRLPLKPLLALALVAVPHTGEVFLNIANTQWIIAVILLQLALKDDWATPRQRAFDLTLLALAGLTGPFSILFLPVFAWRAWDRRTAASISMLTAASICACIQILFIAQGPSTTLEESPQGFDLANLLGVVGRRLVFSLLSGSRVPAEAPAWMIGVAALVLLGALFALALRRDAMRPAKLALWAGLAVLLVSAWHRVHFDRLSLADTINGDRYFFLPKVLLCWLVILETRSTTWIGWTARTALVVGFAAGLSTFRFDPMPDYRWTDHCEAIRRGEPATIPITPKGWSFHYPGRSD